MERAPRYRSGGERPRGSRLRVVPVCAAVLGVGLLVLAVFYRSAPSRIRALSQRLREARGAERVEAAEDLRQAIDPKMDEDTRRAAREAAVPALVDALGSDDPKLRSLSSAALNALAFEAEAAVPAMAVALSDPDPWIRDHCANALMVLREKALPALDALAAHVEDESEMVRDQVIEALSGIGSAAAPTLERGLSSAREDVRASCAYGIGFVGADALVPRLPTLRRLLSDTAGAVRMAAVEAIGRAGPRAAPEMESLVGALADPYQGVRWHAADAIGAVGAAAAPAVPALADLLAHDDTDDVRSSAARALGKIGESSDAVTAPALAIGLRDEHWVVRLHCAAALGRLGGRARDASPALRSALDDPDERVRVAAKGALDRIERSAAPSGR